MILIENGEFSFSDPAGVSDDDNQSMGDTSELSDDGFVGVAEIEELEGEVNVASGSNQDHWLIDSGATHHITHNRVGMHNIESIDE